MIRVAQLTENGWKNISIEEFEGGGLRDEKAFVWCVTNLEYCGGGVRYVFGPDAPESSLDIEEPEHDDNDGANSYWPEDVARYAAKELEDGLEDEGTHVHEMAVSFAAASPALATAMITKQGS